MATPYSTSGYPSGEGTRNVPRYDCSLCGDLKCLDTSLDFFFINFWNIRGLRSNFQSVEQHLSSIKPYLFFLTETQLSEDLPKRKCLWRFVFASLGDLRRYYADFPWNAYCFPVRTHLFVLNA
ncbi:hypothetical protein E2C01_038465 [Portunus trituberculatus]|uniref:Uncharacterized protein n=1 Tax=Portunus trituberculatus TaxID=210409 RepID=A0A5B7FGU4_PORTR|nr:hypothetical protein [Portunus trituberculatus]